VPAGILDAMLPAYTTETPESRVASLISFMDAASPYYQYSVRTMCGIPRIRLFGTVEDWRLLLACARKLAERFDAHLGVYFKHLLPVLKKITEQADPATPVDDGFWRSIYKRDSSSGGDEVTGWATALVHYLKQPDGKLVEKDSRCADWSRPTNHRVAGLKHDGFALHLASVPFTWKLVNMKLPMKFVGGILGVDDEDGFLTPCLSYAVVHCPEANP
jgi:hypothetical protein